mmetsp:Transcript_30038/g.45766  ORF Transcript_30038/g.45766 Transcript_30038/m.45766 type:complete len:151 (-) Transcript_30038:22-474(-)
MNALTSLFYKNTTLECGITPTPKATILFHESSIQPFFSNSPEIVEAYNGIDVGASTCDGVVLSPALFKYFLIFANPLFDETEFNEGRTLNKKRRTERRAASTITEDGKLSDIEQRELLKVELLDTLQRIREKTARRLDTIDKRLESSNEL